MCVCVCGEYITLFSINVSVCARARENFISCVCVCVWGGGEAGRDRLAECSSRCPMTVPEGINIAKASTEETRVWCGEPNSSHEHTT